MRDDGIDEVTARRQADADAEMSIKSRETTDPGIDSFVVAREIGEFKQRLAANAGAMADDDPLMMPVTLAVSLLTLAEGAVTLRQALPGAFLAMVCGRLIDRHAALSPGDAVALAARMMVGEAQREVMLNLAEAAIDDYLAIRVETMERPDDAEPGEAIGGFEPSRGDEVELDLAMIDAAEVG